MNKILKMHEKSTLSPRALSYSRVEDVLVAVSVIVQAVVTAVVVVTVMVVVDIIVIVDVAPVLEVQAQVVLIFGSAAVIVVPLTFVAV